MTTEIRVDEWQAEVERLGKPMTRENGWITITELAEAMKRSRCATRWLLQQGVKAGQYEKATGAYLLRDGRIRDATVYRVVTETPHAPKVAHRGNV